MLKRNVEFLRVKKKIELVNVAKITLNYATVRKKCGLVLYGAKKVWNYLMWRKENKPLTYC